MRLVRENDPGAGLMTAPGFDFQWIPCKRRVRYFFFAASKVSAAELMQ